jgi:hypothetical protein
VWIGSASDGSSGLHSSIAVGLDQLALVVSGQRGQHWLDIGRWVVQWLGWPFSFSFRFGNVVSGPWRGFHLESVFQVVDALVSNDGHPLVHSALDGFGIGLFASRARMGVESQGGSGIHFLGHCTFGDCGHF